MCIIITIIAAKRLTQKCVENLKRANRPGRPPTETVLSAIDLNHTFLDPQNGVHKIDGFSWGLASKKCPKFNSGTKITAKMAISNGV